jgi:putative transcriptional regulator
MRHDEEGAFGVVINRPLPSTVAEVWQALGNEGVSNTDPVYLGGPVSGPLLALHCEPDYGEGEDIVPGVYYATFKEHLNQIVATSTRPFRIFSGYSGWGEGQLESEFDEGSWLCTPASAHDIFADDEELWKAVAERIGFGIMMQKNMPRHIPRDPEMN